MFISEETVSGIIFRSLDFKEREYFQNKKMLEAEYQVPSEFWKAWLQTVAGGNNTHLKRRMEWDSGEHLLAENFLSDFTSFLTEWFQFDISGSRISEFSFNHSEPIPFEEMFIPLVLFARERLSEKAKSNGAFSLCPPFISCLSTQGYSSLESALAHTLSEICKWTLLDEFSKFRPQGINFLNTLSVKTENSGSKLYKKFVDYHAQESLLSLFETFPVLARLIYNAVTNWVRNSFNFLERINKDYSIILEYFFEHGPGINTSICEINTSLSDPHDGGKTVFCVVLKTGHKFIYKPRSLAIENSYFNFLQWCNDNGISGQFKLLKLIPRIDYGWVECAEYSSCKTEEQVALYYFRTGMLLCVFHILRGTDLHCENLIANGEFPVIIDLESLFHSDAAPLKNSPTDLAADSAVFDEFASSVLRTGFLPYWNVNSDSVSALDNSGLGAPPKQEISDESPIIIDTNTDSMHISKGVKYYAAMKHHPVYEGNIISPENYLSYILDGFERTYNFFGKFRRELMRKDSPLSGFNDTDVRFIFRNTAVYSSLLYNLSLPSALGDGNTYRLEIERLSRIFILAPHKPPDWDIIHSEMHALKCRDIPHFITKPNSRDLSDGSHIKIENYFSETAFSRVMAQLKEMKHRDLQKQLEFIRGTFYARFQSHVSSNPIPHKYLPKNTSGDRLPDYECISKQLANVIIDNSFKQTDLAINWIGLSFLPKAEKYHYRPINFSLYDGVCGIALFFAALYKIYRIPEYKEVCLKSIYELTFLINNRKKEDLHFFVLENGIGGGIGLGSMIYSLTRISEMIGDPSILNSAVKISFLVTPEIIKKDRHLDLMAGTAGLLLGLIAIFKSSPSPRIGSLINTCCNHLIDKITFADDGCCTAWKTFASRPLTGFSHGAAGISYALIQAYNLTQDPLHLDAGLNGFKYEQSVFNGDVNNWPDFSQELGEEEAPRYLNSWCHGAPGITLSRLGVLGIIETESMQKEIDSGLLTTNAEEIRVLDHLCCGNFGLAEVLLVSGIKLNNIKLKNQSRDSIDRISKRFMERGHFSLFHDIPSDTFNPGLFRGLSGVGYQYLRFAYPDEIPSVLLWE